ncbi:MAG: AhpC/TSA family protein [Bacteroidaceae bacterium]|nr:AhpC/TSA family protein [Bacteroidaceae bacterium]
MKKLSSLLCAAVASVAAMAQNGGYTVSGVVENGLKGDTVYMCQVSGYFSLIPTDTTVMTDGGKFTFKGNCNTADIRFAVPVGKKNYPMAMFILENSNISINIPADTLKQPVVKGGPASVLYDEYQKKNNEFAEQSNPLWAVTADTTLSEAERAKAQAKLDSITTLSNNYLKEFVISHIPSAISDMFLPYCTEILSSEELKNVLDRMSRGHHYDNYIALVEEMRAKEATQLGKKYTDIELPDTNGKLMRVSDYVSRNKYTLIDFWASWCGPCRAEMPNVVKAYDLYHSKGFEVIGVSLDNNRNAWIKALDVLHMPWPQMSDLKGWQSAGAAAYNVKAIPANVLIDQNGTIIAKDLREEALQDKLKELFK